MNAREMSKILSGSVEQKQALFDELLARLTAGEQLEDYCIPILETLKKDLMVPKPAQLTIVPMELSVKLSGVGGAKV